MPDVLTSPICFQAASKTYRDFFLRQRVPALNGLTLSVEQGQTLALLGPNGSGKSTAIKLLCGLLRPTAGNVRLMGADPRVANVRRGLAYLSEENANYPFLPARQAVALHARLAGRSRSDALRQADHWLERVGLIHAANRPAGGFSKGMARRLGLAQCLVTEPRVLVLDEPTSGLDPVAVELVRTLLVELKTRGVTILLASHVLAEIEDICDRIAILSRGTLIKEGDARQLLTLSGKHEIRFTPTSTANPAEIEAWLKQRGAAIDHSRTPARSLSDLYRDHIKEAE